jgi:hypothetical protein
MVSTLIMNRDQARALVIRLLSDVAPARLTNPRWSQDRDRVLLAENLHLMTKDGVLELEL